MIPCRDTVSPIRNSVPFGTPNEVAGILALMEEPDVVTRLREYFALPRPGLVAVYLYGSLAREEGRPDSDVDLGLLYETEPKLSVSGPAAVVEGELEDLLGRTVQVVILNAAPPDLIHRVLRDGEILYEGDRSRRIRFEVAARNEYFDLLPFLLRYRRMVKNPT
ncbi:hypothetical protein BH18GEM1_BH18GEM1_21300 [soil metagenome]